MRAVVIAGGLALLCLLSAGLAVWNSPFAPLPDLSKYDRVHHDMASTVWPGHYYFAKNIAALDRNCNARFDYRLVCRAGARAFERCAAYFDHHHRAELLESARAWREVCLRYDFRPKYTDDAIDVNACIATVKDEPRIDSSVLNWLVEYNSGMITKAYCPRELLLHIRQPKA